MSSSDPISRGEHEEFARRIESQQSDQNRRLQLLEDSVREIGALTTSVERLALSVETMVKVQEKQGERLEALEGRDGDKWRRLMGYIASAGAASVIGYLLGTIGII